jgi:hypothetical protein
LRHQDAQQIERADVPGLRAQQLFEGPFRLGYIAGLQKSKRTPKRFVSRKSHWAYLFGWRCEARFYSVSQLCTGYLIHAIKTSWMAREIGIRQPRPPSIAGAAWRVHAGALPLLIRR